MTKSSSRAYTAAGGDGDLDGVAPGLADVLEVERAVARLPVPAPLYRQHLGVDGRRHRHRPVGVGQPVLMVETLELQLQV